MKNRIIISLALALALALLAGCGAKEKPYETRANDTTAQSGPDTENSAVQDAAPHGRRDAYAAYLDILAANREGILGYEWQKGMIFDEDIWESVPAGEPTPVAFADVWGDDTPELIFLSALAYDGFLYGAELHVYTWENGASRELYGETTLDSKVGGGENYRLFQTEGGKSLWLYTEFETDTLWETYLQFSAEGVMEPRHTYEYSAFAEEPVEEDGEWSLQELWQVDGKAYTREDYESAIPTEEEQARGLLMRNAYDYEYLEGYDAPEGAYPWPEDGAALSYDGAAEFLRGELGISFDPNVDEAAFFAALPTEFYFSSGAGGWGTELSLAPDGSFTGEFHDSDMGTTGPGYPYGTVYVCSFSGRFGDVKRVDEYTCSMRLLDLTTERVIGDEWIEDEVRYVSSDPYGLEDADEFLVYLPGSYVRGLPREFVTWVSMPRAWGPEDRPVLLPFYGLYNVANEAGFSGEVADTAEVRAQWADDLPLAADGFEFFALSVSEYSSRVAFSTGTAVRDFKVLALTFEDADENGNVVFSTEPLYSLEELTPERPLVVQMEFPGDIPSHGVSYTDADGAMRRFSVGISGMDGSLILSEF